MLAELPSMAWDANSDSPVTENSLYASVPKMLICIARLYCFLSPLPLVLLYNSASLLFFSWTKSLAFWRLVSLNSLSLNTIYFPNGVSPSGTLTFGTPSSSLLLPVADTQPSSECSDRHFLFFAWHQTFHLLTSTILWEFQWLSQACISSPLIASVWSMQECFPLYC